MMVATTDLFDVNLVGCLDSVKVWHGDIQNDDVGPHCLGQRHGFPAVACLADNLEVLLLLKNQPQSPPHHGVVVGKNDTDQMTGSSTLQRLASSGNQVERMAPLPGLDSI